MKKTTQYSDVNKRPRIELRSKQWDLGYQKGNRQGFAAGFVIGVLVGLCGLMMFAGLRP